MVHNNKGIIKQFDLVIYPIDYVVVIGEMENEVNKNYYPYEEEYKNAHIAPPSKTGATYRVRERATDIPCVMIWIKEKENCTSSIIAHECGHAILELWSYIHSEVSLTNQEPFCYTLGNLVRLAVGCFYELPGITPPAIKSEAFEDKGVKKLRKSKPKKK